MRPLALAALGLLAAAAPAAAAPGFAARVTPIPSDARERMTPSAWRPGCPVGLEDLRWVRMRHWDYQGRVRTGVLVVHEDVAPDVVRVFRDLFRARFPIRQMRPIEAYGGSDFDSIEADNTSAFNCRAATGSRNWSQHAYGRAIDVNPILNPYVEAGGRVYHRGSRAYVDRRPRPGMAVEGGALVRAFDAAGWEWGGRWNGVKDYQHFSSDGG
ncbi:MAG: M15 family metallopeptidase [Thermoleophilia bacterium]|nr:M15 family metallopeptidase [Thermoleophilia bacterium]